MNQRLALLLAGALTAFLLVLMGSVASALVVLPGILPPAQAQAEVSAQPQPDAQIQTAPVAQPVVAANRITMRLTPQQAASIAQTTAPRTRLVGAPELVNYNGTVAYEVVLDRGTLYVDANNGKVLENGAASVSSKRGGESHEEREEHEEHEEDDDD